MADRIIKPDSGNDVVIQNNGGTRKLEVTNAGDVEVTGDFKATTVKATNLKANDGTASLEIADSTGDIGFSGNTDLKIKLPSAGGIYESDGSTQVMTESGGAVTIQNATFNGTIGDSATFPSSKIIQVKNSGIYGSSSSLTVTRSGDAGNTLVNGLSIGFTPKKTNSDIIFTLNGLYITGGAARAITNLYAKQTSTPLSTDNLDHSTKFSGTSQIESSNISNGVTATTGWTFVGRFFYRTANSEKISSSTLHLSNANLPSYTSGQTLQFAIGIGNDTSGYTTTYNLTGNTTAGQITVTIFEISA